MKDSMMEQNILNEVYGFLRSGILCLDAEENIRYLNHFALSILEVQPEQIIGQKFTSLFTQEQAIVPGRHTWSFRSREMMVDFTCPVENGPTKLPIASTLTFAELRGWNVMRFIPTKHATRQQTGSFADIGLILFHNSKAHVIYGDKNARDLLGYDGPGDEMFEHPDASIPVDCPVFQTCRDGRIHQKELLRNGREYLITSYPITGAGKSSSILLSCLDMTDLNCTQNKLAEAMRETEAANKAKSFFLSNMSHELRTPLNAVIGYCELLQEGGLLREESAEYLNCINLSGNALLRLINNILDLSKIEAGQMVLAAKPTDLSSLVMELTTVFRQSCAKNQIEQIVDIQPNLPLLLIDELRLRQIMLNLLGNACKFTTKGYVKTTVRYIIEHNAPTGTLAITVEDSGRGIAPEMREAVFQPFTQQDAKKNPHVYKGTGLGLAISNEMALRMGGRIELESELGKGSRFTVILEHIPIVQQVIAADSASLEQLPKEFLDQLDVVLVDDVPLNVKMLAAMCKTFGVKNRAAGSGEEALQLMRKSPPNLVLTDMWMPVMDGVELLAEIRKDENLKHIPVIIVTADVEAKEKGDLEKFDAVILKPVSKEKLRNLFMNQYTQGKVRN